MNNAARGGNDLTQFYECKYCKEKFHPLLAHDLHVMSKHGTQWASAPCYAKSGVFSLAANDLVKIARREFATLSSVTMDDIRKNRCENTIGLSSKNAGEVKAGKRRAEAVDGKKGNDNVAEKDGAKDTSMANETKRPRIAFSSDRGTEVPNSTNQPNSHSSVQSMPNVVAKSISNNSTQLIPSLTGAPSSVQQPANNSYPKPAKVQQSTITSSKVQQSTITSSQPIPSSNVQQSANNSTLSMPSYKVQQPSPRKTVTTYVARSVRLSRQNRLALAGKPYYLETAGGRQTGLPDKRQGRPSSAPEGVTAIHAFRCFPKAYGPNEKDVGGVYVFQPADAVDLLRNLTSKTTKARRQKQTAHGKSANEKEKSDKGKARFANRRRSKGIIARNRNYGDRYDDRHYSDSSYHNFSYSSRIRRGRIYDTRINKVQAGADVRCETKNCLHLQLFKSPAGDIGQSVNEAPFCRKDKPSHIGSSLAKRAKVENENGGRDPING